MLNLPLTLAGVAPVSWDEDALPKANVGCYDLTTTGPERVRMRTRRIIAVSAVIGLAMAGITVSAALAQDDLPRATAPDESQVSSDEFSVVDLSEGVFSDALEPITSKYEDVFGGRVFDRQTATTMVIRRVN